MLHYAENPHGSSLGLRLPAAGRSSKAHSGFLVHELDGGCCITLGQLLGGQHGIEESLAALRRMPDFVVHAEHIAQHHAALLELSAELSAQDLGSPSAGYYWPPNWWSVPQLDVDAATAIIQDEGIPLAWVPRAEIVADLTAALDAATRGHDHRGQDAGDRRGLSSAAGRGF